MKKNKAKILIGCGIFCVLCILVSSWYAVKFNDSRLVVPMDFNSYTFQIKDLPMIISVSLICIYVFTLFITLIVSIGRNRQQIERTNTTRKLNPKLGFLGLLGFGGSLDFGHIPLMAVFSHLLFSYSLASSDFTMKEKCREHLWMNASVKTQSLPN